MAQTVAINTAGATGDSSSMLDISSTNKGLLIPRMSTSQIGAIVAPAKGLLVYDLTTNQFKVNIGNAVSPNWQIVVVGSGNSWSLTGNSGTHPANNFIGTTDNNSLQFRTNNNYSGRLDGSSANVFLGNNSGKNTTGYSNVAIGAGALFKNIVSNNSVAVGDSALYNHTSTFFNEANTAIGSKALFSDSSGYANTATGEYALYSNIIGSYNTANGWKALYSNTSYGGDNTATGAEALYSNTYGSWNTATGENALGGNASGSWNTATGGSALEHNTTGVYNTAIGIEALHENVTGGYNTAIGTNATTAYGFNLTNASAIGANATVNSSNEIQLGDPNVTEVNTYGDITVRNEFGLIRSNDKTQQKKVTTIIPVIETIGSLGTINIPFNFSESFSAAPDVYVGNVSNPGAGGFAELVLTVSGVTSTGATLFVFNPLNSTATPDYSIKIIAIGPQ